MLGAGLITFFRSCARAAVATGDEVLFAVPTDGVATVERLAGDAPGGGVLPGCDAYQPTGRVAEQPW